MKTVDAYLAIENATWDIILQNFQVSESGVRSRNDLTVDAVQTLNAYVEEQTESVKLNNSDYKIIHWEIPQQYKERGKQSSGLFWLEYLLTTFPGKIQIIAVFDNGLLFGKYLQKKINGVIQIEKEEKVVEEISTGKLKIEGYTAEGQPVYGEELKEKKVSYVKTGEFIDFPNIVKEEKGTEIYPLHPQINTLLPTYNEKLKKVK